MTSRRKFLQNVATSGLSAAALATFPPSIRRALAIPAHHDTGTIKDVQHVVLLMMENRSFDSYFGTFKGVRGYGDRFAVPASNGQNVFFQTYTKTEPATICTSYHLDETQGNALRAGSTPHTWSDSQAAWDHGRMSRWPDAKTPLSMGYYETAEVPFQRALADAFTLCDHYHCGMHAGTIANRLFYFSGTNGPSGVSPADGGKTSVAVLNNQYNAGNDIGPSTEGWTWTTYAERLQQAGVSWKVYQSLIDNCGCNEMMSFRHWRAQIEQMPPSRRPVYVPRTDITQPATLAGPFYDPAVDDALSPLAKGFGNTMPHGFLETFRADIQAGTLPAVSWIIPPSVYSEHPGPSSPTQGGWYVQEVLDALTSNPEVWSKTVLLINFDENDGFFDHLPPPSAPSHNPDGSLAGGHTLSDAEIAVEYHNYTPATANQPAMDGRPYGPGPRVPMWVVSPWSRGGWVNSQVCDHTSTLLFLEKRFGVVEPQISKYRRAICGDLTSAFNFADPNREPLPVLSGSKTKTEADTLAASQQNSPKIPAPVSPSLPAQATGVRPSRALPYALHTRCEAERDKVKLQFINEGKAGAVFHVYDKLHLDRVPHRYVVEAGKSLKASWEVADDGGKYDLWVLGPNGYHRRYAGDLGAAGKRRAPRPEVELVNEGDSGHVRLEVRNDGDDEVRFSVKWNKAYGALSPKGGQFEPERDGAWTATVRGGHKAQMTWKLRDNGNWYDLLVTADSDSRFTRRLAGRVETGDHSVSDPAMGMADRF
ncbi:phosphocholine-specific phospholipase C [Bordetella flabilis]|uniref:phospholipase C n=1 Tax=Bordetella flabilis TaxID=463014 RepID=A0A193GEE2_9BORD|nr:phospholipase C, phosphocholine-specific [Bordetella flabilis]ANN77978.1 phospholipase C, phosphocholine-specific [Bordetella flabilis]